MGSPRFTLTNGQSVEIDDGELRRISEGLWELSEQPGAVSTAVLLMHESRQHEASRRAPVELTHAQTNALRRALSRPAELS